MGRSQEQPDKSVHQVQLTVPENVGMEKQTNAFYDEGKENSGASSTSINSGMGIGDNTARKGEFLRARPDGD